ncbi:efflux transporter periplasmic adaptor subunit [Syntrophotalea acetylenivorans]|uniref:Efflux transporter periplasmic adaptor subunit n=1 Tax=Syntrophotalea acetylenivorans TaxID=1842532 RepID=A0A1L3GNK8_9BACT|nr:efflux RND transporter periplasmic adaptor subunit [Syntrophotalea acetylenivorans]APG27519.1 efflux transporter periplasmic adaptor subunit [Syntrophotalea acetylenivorans]
MSTKEFAPIDNVRETLQNSQSRGVRPRRRTVAVIAFAVLLLIAGYVWLRGNGDPHKTHYLNQKATRGTLVVKVTATGNLEPTNQVEVGSEMSGTIATVYVDDNDRVTKGQALAVLDLTNFKNAVARSQAAVAVAKASLQQTQATIEEAGSKLARYREVFHLSGGKVPSKTEMEAAEAEFARAEANVASARANIAEAEATLNSDQTDLDKATIRSPIDGVVLERSVDPGQAVAASLQAVTLFTLAEDLSQMELEVDVDEADVGQVKTGLKASFTVDAWPERTFKATITRVGLNASDGDGVISYPTVLQVANDDLSLRPGMTGIAEITTITRENALLVPNAALRFSPPAQTANKTSRSSLLGSLMPRPPGRGQQDKPQTAAKDSGQTVWILREGQAVPLQVTTGTSNGQVTEILGDPLQEDMEVITETASAQS